MLEARKFTHRSARAYAVLAAFLAACALSTTFLLKTSAEQPREVNVDPIPVSLPNMTAIVGTNFTIPVTAGDTTGEAIRAIQFDLLYDQTVIVPQASPVETAGTISDGMSVTINNTVPGTLRVVFFSSTHRTGSGTLFRFRFTAVGDPGEVSPLTWSNFMFNEGDPAADLVNGSVTLTSGLEGDTASRFTGDGALLSNDVILARRFAVGIAIPDPAFNEFQRADVSPFATRGDGQIDSSDVIQARRYAASIDPPTPVGGPTGPINAVMTGSDGRADLELRSLRIRDSDAAPGTRASIAIELNAVGNEAGASFTLAFDPAKLADPRVYLPDGNGDSELTVNTSAAGQGLIMVLVDSGRSLASPASKSRMIEISFDVLPNAAEGPTWISFSGSPTRLSVSDTEGALLNTSFQNGRVMISRGKSE